MSWGIKKVRSSKKEKFVRKNKIAKKEFFRDIRNIKKDCKNNT
jgi:hypothetical protein